MESLRLCQVLREAEEEVAGKWKEGEAGNSFRLVLAVNKTDLLPKQVGSGSVAATREHTQE